MSGSSRKQSYRTMEYVNYFGDNDNRSNWWKWRWKSEQIGLATTWNDSSDSVIEKCSHCNFNCGRIHRSSSSRSDKQSDLLVKENWTRVSHMSSCSTHNFVTLFNFLVILVVMVLVRAADAFPTSDCDWTGSGSRENIVQAVYLRCQRGQITWESPRGGLRVNISPPTSMLPSFSSLPYRLCLESTEGKNYRVFLEQSGSEITRKLLPFIAPDTESTVSASSSSSRCYRISTTTATLYVESMRTQLSPEDKANRAEDNVAGGGQSNNKLLPHSTLADDSNHNEDQNQEGNDAHYLSQQIIKQQVKISYEIEFISESSKQSKSKSPGGMADDECRPCSDDEVLQLYCVADVVARGEILSVKASKIRKNTDTLHLKSDLVIHQNHPIFKPLKPGNKNLQKFFSEDIHTFDENSPKKATNSKGVTKTFGGIVSHPRKCSAQAGPGDFLWLIKLSFGRPKIGCVLYWDKWVRIATAANEDGTANCPLVF